MNLHPSFVGRVAEVATLEEALARAILGRGATALVSGEPGVGKTRLAAELADRAARRGARVLWARCSAGTGAPAFWPIVQLLRPLHGDTPAATLAQRFGPGGADVAAWFHADADGTPAPGDSLAAPPPFSDTARFRLFDAATRMLLAAAREKPLVAIVDDVHDADPACLQLLVFLARAVHEAPAMVVATTRTAEARRPEIAPLLLGSLARESIALTLDGLSRDEVAVLLSQSGRRAANDDLVESVHRASAGNPFFVGELARILAECADAPQEGAPLPVPAHVHEAVSSRLAVVSAPARGLLDAAAVLGLSFDASVLTRVVRSNSESIAHPLQELGEAGFLQRDGASTWAFRHELVRDVVLDAQSAAERRSLHRSCAAALERRGGEEAVAHHLLAALPDGDIHDAIRRSLDCANAALAAYAPERAAAWLRRGLNALDLHSPPNGSDAENSRDARDSRRDFVAASAEHDRAAADAALAMRAELLLALGEALWSAGEFAASRVAYEDAASLAEGRADDRADDRLRGGQSDDRFAGRSDAVLLARAALGLGGRQQRAHVHYDAALVRLLERARAALGDRERPLRARVLARLAYSLYAAPASRDEREDLSEEALTLVRDGCDDDTRRWVLGDCRWALWGPATLHERRRLGDELRTLAQRHDDRAGVLVEEGWRIVDHVELGDRAAVDQAFASQRGGAAALRLPWFDWYAARFACLLAQVDGRLDEAERFAADALAAGERAGHPDAGLTFGTQMLGVRLAQDRLVELETALEAGVAQYPDLALWRRLLARLRLAQGRDAEALAEVDRAGEGPLVDAPGDYLHLPCLVLLAELAAVVGGDAERRRIAEALRPYRGRHVVLGFGLAYLGPVDLFLGDVAAALGDGEAALEHLDAAIDQSMRFGAPRWAARARLSRRALVSAAPATTMATSTRHEATAVNAALLHRERPAHDRFPSSGSVHANASGDLVAEIRYDGANWRLTFGDARFHLGPLRGLTYLHALVASPEREFHALDLSALADPGTPRPAKPGAPIIEGSDHSDLGPVLDDAAKQAYRVRLAELKAELDRAEEFADAGRSALVRAELEALQDELARAVGLGGRDRRAGASTERARVAVAKRIRAALTRVGEHSPPMQRYLEATVRTGATCVYRPDPGRPVSWKRSTQ